MHANGKLVTNVLSAAFTMLLVLILGILEWKYGSSDSDDDSVSLTT